MQASFSWQQEKWVWLFFKFCVLIIPSGTELTRRPWQQWEVELSWASERSRVHPYFGSASWATHQSPRNATPPLSYPTVVSVNLEGTVLALSPCGGHWLHLLVSPTDERASFCWTAIVLRMVFLRLSQKYTFSSKQDHAPHCTSLHLAKYHEHFSKIIQQYSMSCLKGFL